MPPVLISTTPIRLEVNCATHSTSRTRISGSVAFLFMPDRDGTIWSDDIVDGTIGNRQFCFEALIHVQKTCEWEIKVQSLRLSRDLSYHILSMHRSHGELLYHLSLFWINERTRKIRSTLGCIHWQEPGLDPESIRIPALSVWGVVHRYRYFFEMKFSEFETDSYYGRLLFEFGFQNLKWQWGQAVGIRNMILWISLKGGEFDRGSADIYNKVVAKSMIELPAIDD